MYQYILFAIQSPDEGATGAQEIFSYALGLLDAIDVLGYVRAVIYLVMVVFATKIIFTVLAGK
jgi:hypothetical protein